MGLVKAPSQAGLFAFFEERDDVPSLGFGNQQFDGIGANIDDGAVL